MRTRVRAELARPDPASSDEPADGWLGEPGGADEEVEIELMRRRAERLDAGDAS